MSALITVEEFKSYPLPITEKQYEKITDEQIEIIIGYASEHIEDYCDRHFASAYYAERIVGSGRPVIILENYPVTALLSITSADFSETNLVYANNKFIIHGGEVGALEWREKSRYSFYNNYVWIVNYQAGYATIPGPVKHAVALQTVEMLQPLFRGGTNFASVEIVAGITEMQVEMLERFRRKRIG